MGQKVQPVGFRTGIMVDWQSRWYAGKADFAELLVEDQKKRIADLEWSLLSAPPEFQGLIRDLISAKTKHLDKMRGLIAPVPAAIIAATSATVRPSMRGLP